MHKAITALSIAFFLFILGIIYLANTGGKSVLFTLLAAIPYGDKLGHFCLFGVLTLGVNFSCKLKSVDIFGNNMYVGAIIVFCFALLEELSQFYISNRTLDIADLTADVLGIIAFSFLTRYLSGRRKKSG